jgi:hypothetical protein
MFYGDTFFTHVLLNPVPVTLHGLAETAASRGADRHHATARQEHIGGGRGGLNLEVRADLVLAASAYSK